jgi:hypothetical protein
MAVNTKTVIQNIFIGLIVAAALFSSFIVLSYSVFKIVIVAAVLITAVMWLVLFGKPKRILKYIVLTVMIFAITFASVEVYLFQNSGYPPTYSSMKPNDTLSMQTMLNASLTEIIRGIEQSTSFRLLKLEHGNIIFESIGLNPIGIGGIDFNYFIEDTHSYVRFTSSGGRQYHISISQLIGQPFSEKYSSMQTVEQTLTQIDALSLQGFYDKALQIAQNRTSDLPTIDSLSISISYEGYRDYQGITLQMLGHHETVLPNGSINGKGVLIADFQPDGTLLYMSQPTPQ